MSNEFLLYDLPGKHGHCWSFNAWKARLVLNYKGLPYKTEWTPYRNMSETLKSTGVEPNDDKAWAAYTIPALRFPDGSHVMDSHKIAVKLEELKPEPSLHLNPELEDAAVKSLYEAVMPMIAWFMPFVGENIIAEDDVEWFDKDRSARFGMSMDELAKQKTIDQAWEDAKPGFQTMIGLLTNHKKDEGPFVLGSQPSFVDFIIVALIYGFKASGEDVFARMMAQGKEFRELYEACKEWGKRDD